MESRVEQRLRSGVRDAGGLTEKLAPTRKGMPDRLVLLAGRMWLVELKDDRGRLSPAQVAWHDAAAATGCPVVVLQGAADVDAWLADVTPPVAVGSGVR